MTCPSMHLSGEGRCPEQGRRTGGRQDNKSEWRVQGVSWCRRQEREA